MEMKELVRKFYEKKLIKFGNFKLTSGIFSPFYINLKGLIQYPDLMKITIQKTYNLLKNKAQYDVVASIATGGIPFASYFSCLYEIPMAYIRKEKRYHGTKQALEGNVNGKKVLLIDDVATTGSSLITAINVIRANNGEVEHAVVIVDREQGANEKLSEIGVTLHAILTASQMFHILYDLGCITKETLETVVRYLRKE